MSSSQILQAERESTPGIGFFGEPRNVFLPLLLLAVGFGLRIANAVWRFLNADEALHYFLSVGPSVRAAEHASLTTSHPPLLIVFLYYWRMLGHAEWFLRLPHVVAGTAFCWVMFSWMRRVTNQNTALVGLVLSLFAPTLVLLSAEIRQYAFLLFFSSLSLHFLDRGIEEDAPGSILLAAVALYLALLVHYASLIVALTLGLYAILRWAKARTQPATTLAWFTGQLGAIGVVAFLFLHHVSKLRARGQPQAVAETYAHRSIFWPGEEHAWTFVGRNTIRVFHYFFNQGAVGVLALLLFVYGIVVLVRSHDPGATRKPSSRQLAFLFVLPFVVNSMTGLLRLYPYGGSRHDIYLAIFAIPAIAVPLARWGPARKWWKPLAISGALALCYLFPHAQDEYIRWRNQNRRLMMGAVAALRALPANAIIFTDDQGGLLLSYYLCNSRAVEIEQRPFQPFLKARCGDYWLISLDPDLWIFKAETFADTFERAQRTYDLHPGTPVWLFQAGWFVDQESALRQELADYGCTAQQDFGKNMFLCRLSVHAP
jgi:hypothetical protein